MLIIELKEFTASALDGTYKNFGTALVNPAIKISIYNTSNVDVYLSKDAATHWLRVPSGGTLTLDESTLYNKNLGDEYYLPAKTQLTVTQVTAPGATGSIIAHVVTRGLFL